MSRNRLQNQLTDPAALARVIAANVGRPLLIREASVAPLLAQLQITPERPSRLAALGRMLGFGARQSPAAPLSPLAYDDYDDMPVREGTVMDWLGEDLRPAVPGLADSRISGEGWGYVIADDVAVIGVQGPLVAQGGYFCGAFHGYDTIAKAHAEAQADGRVKAILLLADTPGGVVHDGLNALAAEMRAGAKPSWTHAEMACSAGYWMASASDKIVAGRYSQIGSIGVVIVHQNAAKALASDGIEITTIEFPADAEKTAGAWWKALSESTRADLQSDVDQIGADFLAAVVAGRPDLKAKDLEALGARVFMGHHDDAARSALNLGLIDDIVASPLAALDALAATLERAATAAPVEADAPKTRAEAVTSVSQEKEASMAIRKKLSAAMPGLRAAAAKPNAKAEDTLKAIQDLLDEEDADEEEELDDEEADASDDEDDSDDPMATAQAILNLPEAKGREALAKTLAFQKGASLAFAKTALAAATKGGSRLAGLVDHSIGAGGEPGANNESRQDGVMAVFRAKAEARKRAA